MAKNAFYEESAVSAHSQTEAKYYTVFRVLSLVFFVLAGIMVFLSVLWVPDMVQTAPSGAALAFTLILWFGGMAVLVLIGFLFGRIKRRFNVSYDYTFVEDELRITKVFGGHKRKYLVTIPADRILKIGYCEQPSFQSTLAGMSGKKAKYLTPNHEPMEDKIWIYILLSSTIEKSLYVLECRKELLEYLVRAAGINKFERQ